MRIKFTTTPIYAAIVASGLAMVLFPFHAYAGIEEGVAADKRGDCVAALREFRPLAAENPTAKFFVAKYVGTGCGIPLNYKMALELYNQSAAEGEVMAQYVLSFLHSTGSLGAKMDKRLATKWHLQAAIKGHPESVMEIGRALQDGTLPRNLVMAYALINVAIADKGVRDKDSNSLLRNAVERRLSVAQIDEAQNLSLTLFDSPDALAAAISSIEPK